MHERARELVDASAAIPLDDVAAAIRLLASRAHVVAEGAGALALAAALRGDTQDQSRKSGPAFENRARRGAPVMKDSL
jgi:threonine dehydratase